MTYKACRFHNGNQRGGYSLAHQLETIKVTIEMDLMKYLCIS